MTNTLEQLAAKLNGKIWQKENLKRVYLNAGYNTKKMSTKTYIFQDENGNFKASCYIDCPSQDYNWIKSQQQEVISSVEARIEQAIFEINNPDIDFDEMNEQKEIEAKQKEVSENEQKIKESAINYYHQCKGWIAENESKAAAFNALSDAEKHEIESFKLMSNRSIKKAENRQYIEHKLTLLPKQLGQHVIDCASFETADAYADYIFQKSLNA
jgi:hypothetical protein